MNSLFCNLRVSALLYINELLKAKVLNQIESAISLTEIVLHAFFVVL